MMFEIIPLQMAISLIALLSRAQTKTPKHNKSVATFHIDCFL